MVESKSELKYSEMSVDEVLISLETSFKGLKNTEAESRKNIYGENSLGVVKKKSRILIFLNNFRSPLIYTLFIAAFVTLLMREYIDSLVIFTITLINAVIGYFQEQKAESALEALRKMTRLNSVVLREDKRVNIKSENLVPGDVILLEEGDKVPADGRVIESSELLINEAVITGESLPVKKGAQKYLAKSSEEPTNLLFMGTTVLGGRALMVVTATGRNTEFGKISKLVEDESQVIAPLQKKMLEFSKKLGLIVVFVCLSIFVIGLISGRDLVTMVELSISMAVSAIPEGLPVAITVILVMGVKRMAKHKAILRNLSAVETLGTTTVIASDKTGTITHNKLTVTKIYTDQVYRISGEGHIFKGDFFVNDVKVEPKQHILQLLDCGVIVNNGKLEVKKHGADIFGDPTDCAILVAAKKAGITKEECSDFIERLAEIPFSSDRKYQAVLADNSGSKAIYIKGALEEILKRSRYSFIEGKTPIQMTDDRRKEIKSQAKYFASRGLRVIAFAYKEADIQKVTLCEDNLDGGFTFVGLVGMRDTYRSGVRDAIEKCKKAGIRMIMITGDHLDTAKAIGQDIGILNSESEAIEASVLENMSLKEVRKIVKRVNVFARISPLAKYKIIEALKENGEIVAMTGDGVNDVPALKKADIGVAMGVMGTEAAKDASDMVLTDDNFSTIVFAVSEGRAVFSNIRKTLFYLLSTNLGEVLTVLSGLIMGLPLVLMPLQILWINLVTDSLTAIPLGMEPAHSDQINRSPRNPREHLVSKRMIVKITLIASIMAIGSISIFLYSLPSGIIHARTMVFTFLVLIQWFNVFNARTESSSIFKQNPFANKPLLLGLLIAVTLQFSVLYTNFLEHVFELSFLTLNDWAIIVPVAFTTVIFSEIEKLVFRLRHKKEQAHN